MSTLLQVLFVFAALALGFLGFISLSEATTGIGFIALGLLCGVLARISQADGQHRAVMGRLAELTNETAKRSSVAPVTQSRQI